MARIDLRALAHQYEAGGEYALKQMDHTWEDGGAYALLGPSGCGKTTLLNIISGLLTPSAGQVLFDGVDVTRLSPERRNIGQVFQFPVIYDTMTVYGNLAFPLRNRGVAAAQVDRRVRQVAELLSLESVLQKRAQHLGADAKQKISLGRGLVREDVAAVLFDEPLTVIDPHLKWQLRRKLREIHEQLRLTLVYVTHDQTEAMTFADQVVVMYDGQVVQMGTPAALFERPAHTFVGYFIGSPGMNFFDCSLEGADALVEGHRLPLPERIIEAAQKAGEHLQIGIRPEFVRPAGVNETGIPVRVENVEDLGNYQLVEGFLGNQRINVRVAEDEAVASDGMRVVLPAERTMLYADDRLVAAADD